MDEIQVNFKRIFMLADIHLGISANSIEWLDNMRSYFYDFFIPLLKKEANNGDALFILGDLFDNRQSIDILVMNTAQDIISDLSKILEVHIMCGNHDMYKKIDNNTNSIRNFAYFSNVKVYTNPTKLICGNKTLLMFPYSENYNEDLRFILNNECDYLFTHADIHGMKLDNGQLVKKGLRLSESNISRVFSGHIHKRQENNKIIYIGSPYHTSYADINDVKGVYLFDILENSYTFFENDFSPKYINLNLHDILDTNISDVKDMIHNNYVYLHIREDLLHKFNISIFVDLLKESAYKKIQATSYKQQDTAKNVIVLTDANDISIMSVMNQYIEHEVDTEKIDRVKELNMKYYKLASTN